jgi:hypothetical protein
MLGLADITQKQAVNAKGTQPFCHINTWIIVQPKQAQAKQLCMYVSKEEKIPIPLSIEQVKSERKNAWESRYKNNIPGILRYSPQILHPPVVHKQVMTQQTSQATSLQLIYT